MRTLLPTFLGVFAIACMALTPVAVAQAQDIPRTPDGRPDLSGTGQRVS